MRLAEMLPWLMRHIKKHVKAQYDKSIQPHVFNEGDLVLIYDKRYDKLGKGKFESMWYGPFVISKVLEKGSLRAC